MKNKLITNDSYIRKLIKESINYNIKKQNLMEDFEFEIRSFKQKFKSTHNQNSNAILQVIMKFKNFINFFHDEVRKMVRDSHMFENVNKGTLVEDSRFVEENFPNYKKFMNRFLNCGNGQECLFLTNRFIDECDYFIKNMKKQKAQHHNPKSINLW